MRSEIRRIQLETGISAVLVTHDQVEAMSMSDRIAIMKEGEILQVASPTEMYQQPVNDFVAGFLGNPPIAFLDAQVKDGKIDVLNGKSNLIFQEILNLQMERRFAWEFGQNTTSPTTLFKSQETSLLLKPKVEKISMMSNWKMVPFYAPFNRLQLVLLRKTARLVGEYNQINY